MSWLLNPGRGCRICVVVESTSSGLTRPRSTQLVGCLTRYVRIGFEASVLGSKHPRWVRGVPVSVGCVKTKDSYNLSQSSSQNHLHPLPFVVAAFSLVDEILSSSWVRFHAGSSPPCRNWMTAAFDWTRPHSTRQIRVRLGRSAFDSTHLRSTQHIRGWIQGIGVGIT